MHTHSLIQRARCWLSISSVIMTKRPLWRCNRKFLGSLAKPTFGVGPEAKVLGQLPTGSAALVFTAGKAKPLFHPARRCRD